MAVVNGIKNFNRNFNFLNYRNEFYNHANRLYETNNKEINRRMEFGEISYDKVCFLGSKKAATTAENDVPYDEAESLNQPHLSLIEY